MKYILTLALLAFTLTFANAQAGKSLEIDKSVEKKIIPIAVIGIYIEGEYLRDSVVISGVYYRDKDHVYDSLFEKYVYTHELDYIIEKAKELKEQQMKYRLEQELKKKLKGI